MKNKKNILLVGTIIVLLIIVILLTINLINKTKKELVIGENFNTDSWKTIIEAVKNGDASAYKVGDTKEIDMGSYGTHTVRISNITPCDGTLKSETACGFVIEFADVITDYVMNDLTTNVGGWPKTNMRKYLNNDIYNALPIDLKNGIIDTKVISGHGSTAGEDNFESTDKLYLLSNTEVDASGFNDTTKDSNITRQLDYYLLKTSTRIKQNNGSNAYWWLRTADSNDTVSFHCYNSYNGWDAVTFASYDYGVSPAFKIK